MESLAIWVVAGAIIYHAWKVRPMSVDFTRLNAALVSLASSIESVASAIRNPQVDTASQAAADSIADSLEASAANLRGLADEETAMDTADAVTAPAPEPTPEPEPVVEDAGSGEDAALPDSGAGGEDSQPSGDEEEPPVQ